MPDKTTTHFLARKRLIAAAISACFVSAPAWSNPRAPQVVNGSASFNHSGNLLTVTNTNGTIINWNSFSIGANETTRFNQASASSSVLNRVLASDPSVLLGTLSSNGHVWLVNPAGIMVGQGARIDVAGFVASTLNVSNQDFLAGRLSFGATPNAGSIQNDGQITTPSGGSVYLVAPAVTNNGIINAPNGEVILAAGQTVQLVDTGTPGVSVAITGAAGDVTNLGKIISEAGQIGMAGVLVKNSGTLDASSVVKVGGRIFLKASQDAYVDGAGRIVATGTKGGNIDVLGNRVAVMDQAQLDASGDAGGGTVLVGGDAHGANPAVQNAAMTYIGPNASIKADATQNGDGGKAIVWSDDYTQFYGTISARGGGQRGDGGYVETSGKEALSFAGSVDTRAPNGKTGTLLLDPEDIVIADAAAGSQSQDSYGGTIAFSDGGGTFTISTGMIEGLSANTDISLQANNSITMGPISGTHTVASNTLTLQQIRSVSMATTIGTIDLGSGNTLNIVGAGSLSLSAGSNLNVGPIITHTGSVTLTSGTNGGASSSVLSGSGITTNGGSITLIGGDYGTTGVAVGALNTSGQSDGSYQNGGVTITTTSGDISTGSITTAAANPYYGGGSILLQTTSGTINVNGNIDARGADGDATYAYASRGGNVDLIRSGDTPPSSGTAVYVTGNISTYGGNAPTNSGGDGGEGGYVNIAAAQGDCCSSSANALLGDITVGGNIDAHGGAGPVSGVSAAWGGWGAGGGYVYIAGNGATTVGTGSGTTAINTSGGDAGDSNMHYYGYSGGGGGAVTVHGNSIVVNGSVDAHGGQGADGGEGGYGYGYGGGQGGSGGSVSIGADSTNVSIYDSSDSEVVTSSVEVHGSIDTHGGNGGNGLVDDGTYGAGNGGYGGHGGSVTLASTGNVAVDGAVLSYGGIGGYGGAAGTSGYGGGIGGYGGGGGSVDVYGGGVSIGGISAYGGAGGTGGDGTADHQGGDGASGGNGNSVYISSTGDITVSGPIDTRGGQAGDGGAYGGSGGVNCNYVECYDGSAGSITLDASGTVNFHSIVASGGGGGNGMAGGGAFSSGSGGDGGTGGSVDITATSISIVAGGTGTISTYGGSGGNGGDDSANAGAGGNGAYGGYVHLDGTSGPVTTGDIDAYGGNGGNAGAGASGYYGGDGGWGGTVEICADSVTTGSIFTRGGNGGNGGGGDAYENYNGFSDSSHYGAGIGGDGGGIDLRANSAVIVNGSIDVSGGDGGSAGGGYPGGSGGYGGDGGSVQLLAISAASAGAIDTAAGPGGGSSGYGGSPGNWNINADTITLAASDFGFFANGTVNATSAFEFDPINTSSLLITPAFVTQLYGIPTVKFGNGTTTADLTLSGTIDLNNNTTLGLVTSGALAQQDSTPSAGDAVLAVTNLYAQGGSVSLAGGPLGNNVVNLQGKATSGSFAFSNVTSLNIAAGLLDPTVTTGITATGNASLSAGGTLTQSAPLILPGTLTTSSSGGQTLNGTNAIGSFNATNAASGNIALASTGALTLAAISNAGGGSVTVSNAGPIGITGTVAAAGGGAINLVGTAAITESDGGLLNTTGALTTSSVTGQTLNGANAVGSVNAVNTTSGNVSLTNSGPLTLAGINNGGGDLSVTNGGTISITGPITMDGGGAVSLTATGAPASIAESGVGTINTTGALITSSTGGQTLGGVNNLSGRIDMTAGGPLTLWGSGDLNLGAIDAGANPVQIKAGGAILQAPGTGSSTNIIASSADLSSIFGGASGDLAISSNTQITGALTATVGTGADFGGIRIQNSGAQPASVTLTDSALAGSSVSFLNTGDITSTSDITLKTLTGGDLALLSNGNITWDGGSLNTPTGSVLISADGSLGVTGTLSAPVDLALSSNVAINVSGSVVTSGTGTASFTAPSLAINGSVNSADDVGLIADTLNLGAGSSTGAAHDVIVAASNVTATNATVSAGHDISAAVTGDMRLNATGFTAGNDIFIKMLGATSTLYLNDTTGLARAFIWAQAPSTIHLAFPARDSGGSMVVDGVAVDPLKFVSTSGGSGLFYGPTMLPATPGTGLELAYGIATPGALNTVAPTLFDAVIAAVTASTTKVTSPVLPGTLGDGLGLTGSGGTLGSDQTVGGTEGSFGGGDKEDEDKNKKDDATGLKKEADKPTIKKLSTCS